VKAVQVKSFGQPEDAQLTDVVVPMPRSREVRVLSKAIGVNFPDLLVMSGKYQVLPERPFIPGKDAAGVVEAVGSEVRRFKPGDRVMITQEYGCYAEQFNASEDNCHRIPESVSFRSAAAMGLAYQTAYFALLIRGSYKKGETVLVLGAGGGVGLATVQLAKALGANVIAGVRNEAHALLARQCSADHVVDLSLPDLKESLKNQVGICTDGRGADVVIDMVGGSATGACLRAMAWSGRLIIVGFASGAIPEIRANYLLVKNISVLGLQWSDYRERHPDWVSKVQEELFDLVVRGHLKPHIMRQYQLSDFAVALRQLSEGRVEGKVVLAIDE